MLEASRFEYLYFNVKRTIFLDIYTKGPYKLIYVIVICTVFIYVLFYLQ